VRRIVRELGGVQGVLMTAASGKALEQGLGMLDRHGTLLVLGLPPGTVSVPVLDVVLGRKTIRGSMVGTPSDLAAALAMAQRAGVRARCREEPLEAVNGVLSELEQGKVDGRIVLRIRD
jgi:propanol-preferring alcohol dehydrogenase